MRRLVPLLAAALLWPAGAAGAELVAPGVGNGALAVAADGTPSVVWLDGRSVVVAARVGAAWTSVPVAAVPDAAARIAGAAPGAVLVESTRGAWVRLVVRAGPRWRTVVVADVPKDAVLGAAGLALGRSGRPVVAYALRQADEQTSLRLVQLRTDGTLSRTPITRNGFPRSRTPPAALPVRWPDGTIRVVETFTQRGANAILWRRAGTRWWGRVLHASVLGASQLAPYAVAPGGERFALAWTVAQAGGESQLVLTTRPPSRSVVVHRNAFAAGLVLGQLGAELAANEPVGPTFAGLLLGVVQTELDGRILGYAAAGSSRHLLLARPDGLEWFSLPGLPAIRFESAGAGWRVAGATSGTVTFYEELPGAPRRVVAEVPVGPDGSFTFSFPGTAGALYRAVHVDPATGVPYARVLRPASDD